MTDSVHINDREWQAEEVLAMACAIFRTKGFTSVSSFSASDVTNEERWNSKEHLCYQMVHGLSKDYNILIKVTKADAEMAKDIIRHYRKLAFGVIADSLNDYMQSVFSKTQGSVVRFKDFGILASVPSAYTKEMEKKRIETEAKSAVQEYIGTVGNSIELNIRYINSRYIPKLNCYAHDAITNTGHLVNFLNKLQLGKTGDTQTIRAKVKEHGVNFQTKSIETKLNYVKPVDTVFEWQ